MLRFAVEGVAAGAFSGLAPDAALTVDTEAASLLDAVCAPEAGLPADAQLQLGVSESVKITGPSTVELESKAIQLPDGREFSAYLLSGFETVENASDASVTALLPAGSLENYRFEEISLAPGATLNSADVYPGYSAALEYQVDGGAWTQAEASRLGSTTIELPAGTPADAAVDLRIVSPDLSLGYIESSWGGATKRVELANGHAEVSLTLTSNLVEGSQADYSFELSAAEADPEGSVYIDGERYSEAFGFGEGPDGVALSYDEAGSPTVTLDGAHITQASGPVGHDGEYGYRAGIWAAGDLAVRVQGEPSAVVIDDAGSSPAVASYGGTLVVEGDANAAVRPSLALSTADNRAADVAATVKVVSAAGFVARDVALDVSVSRVSASSLSSTLIQVRNDAIMERCDLTLTAPESVGGSWSVGVSSAFDGDISFVDVNATTSGGFGSLFAGRAVSIEGESQMDLACMDDRRGAAIRAGGYGVPGSFSVDLQGARSYVRLGGSPDAENPYALFVYDGGIELGEHTTMTTQPADAQMATIQDPTFSGEVNTLLDASSSPAYAFEFTAEDADTPAFIAGDTFAAFGIEYTVVSYDPEAIPNGTVEISGVEEGALYHFPSSPAFALSSRVAAGYGIFDISGVQEGALSGLAAGDSLALAGSAQPIIDDIFSEESGLSADVDIQFAVQGEACITGPSTAYDSNGAIELPAGREFSSCLRSAFSTFKNDTDADVVMYVPQRVGGEEVGLASVTVKPGKMLLVEDIDPDAGIDVMYRVNGGAWVFGEAYSLGKELNVVLPADTPADASIDMALPFLDTGKGYIECSWPDNEAHLQLEGGELEASVTLTSTIGVCESCTYRISFTVAAEADPEGSVYIDGERYSEAFGFGEGPDGVALSYDEAGSPTVTLDGAHITQASGPVGHDGEYGYRAGIWAAGDLAVRVQGEPSAVVIDELDSPRAISSGGALVIEGDATAAERPTLSLSTRDNLSEDEGAIPEVAYGKTVEVRDVALEAGFERRSSSASSVIVVSSAADVSFERCDVSLFAPEGDAAYSMGVYGSADGGISFVDSNVNTTGDFTRLFVCGKDLVIAGRTQMDLECAAGRADSAIDVGDWANTGSRFVVDLEGADSYVRLNGTADSYPYAVFARGGIELGEHTTLVQPVGGKVGIAQEPFFEYETYTLVDAQGNPAYAFEFAGRDAETPGEGGGESETPAGGSGSDVDATGDSGEKAGFAATGDAAGSIAIASVAAIAAAAVCIRFVRKVCHR